MPYCAAALGLNLTLAPVAIPAFAQAPARSDAAEPLPKAEELAKTLAATSEAHGTDSVALQAALLVHTIAAGAVDATEVRVAGPSPTDSEHYLRYELETGLIFDSESTTDESRLARIWSTILIPSLGRLETVEIRPPGLEFEFRYGLQSFDRNHDNRADPQAPSEALAATVRISGETLSGFVGKAVGRVEIIELCPSSETALPDRGDVVR